MSGQPTPTDAQFSQYAQALAATAFADKKSIAGQELLSALPEKQLNLLVLYRLKERWEAEAAALRSPFFDYEAAPVREAQRKFLNVLSQHIRLGQDTYTQLLTQALQDAWQLASRPSVFLAGLAEKLAKPDLTIEQMQGVAKYVVYHGDLLREALKDLGLTGRSSFLKGDLFRQIQQIEDRMPAAARDRYVNELSYFLSTVVVFDEPVEEEPVLIEEEETEPFFALEASLEAEPTSEPVAGPETAWPAAASEEPAPAEDALIPEPEPQPEPAPFVFEAPVFTAPAPEPEPEPAAWPEAPSEEPAPADDRLIPEPAPIATPPSESATYSFLSSSEEAKEESLGERLARQQQGQGLYAKVSAAAASENLHSLIAIGDRYMMVGQLFGGDMASYSLAVSHVNSLTTLEEAIHYLWDEFSARFSWNPESEAYKTLDTALRRKFAA